jgi:hypothetical protein
MILDHFDNSPSLFHLDIYKTKIVLTSLAFYFLRGFNDFTQKSNSLLEKRCIVMLLTIHL